MKIATIEEVNLLGCCTCDLPTCDNPRKECENKSLTLSVCGAYINQYGADCPDNCKRWRSRVVTETFNRTSTPSGIWTVTTTTTYSRGINGTCEISTSVVVTGTVLPYSFGTRISVSTSWVGTTYTVNEVLVHGTIDTVTVYSDPETTGILESSAKDILADLEFTAGDCNAIRNLELYPCNGETELNVNCPKDIYLTFFRYRFGIPIGYTRSTWEMQWDEGFFSQAWIDWDSGGKVGPEPTPPSLLASRSWNYSGASDWSDWFEIESPDENGQIKVVNVMIKCWKSARLGVKPTSFGEIFVFNE
jgi:hypothetical protein